MTVDEAVHSTRTHMQRRDEVFLELIERGVFSNARSPYLQLMRMAGCEFGDIKALVGAEGIEETLRRLRSDGVYVSFEEFKGRRPIERHGRAIKASPEDFDNPLAEGGAYRSRTSGSTGRPMSVVKTLEDVRDKVPRTILGYAAHGLLGAPTARLGPTSRRGATALVDASFGQAHERWFATQVERGARSSLGVRASLALQATAARLAGVRLASPEPIGVDGFHVVAEWASARVRAEGRCVVRANTSNALRVATAAIDRGIDLEGVTFLGGGEPATVGKVEGIARSGARFVPVYTLVESGRVGIGCARPSDPSDVHLLNHQTALIAYPRTIPGTSLTVASFHLTSIRFGAPKLLLNVESDDYGIVERRSCGCLFDELGFSMHLRDIYSFGKLTGDGVTLVSSDMVRVLDEVLPAKFGGSSIDYQLVEEEDERGFTRLTLVVDPSVPISDESVVISTLLAELGRDPVSIGARSIWRQTGALRIERREPAVGSTGKVHPLVRATRTVRRR